MAIDDVIAVLGRATEGSALLDVLIARSLGWVCHAEATPKEFIEDWWGVNWFSADGRHAYGNVRDFPFTTDLNKGLSLVPDGWEWAVSNRGPAPHAGRAYINNREPYFVGMGAAPNPALRQYQTTAATPAIALCIVCLKAQPSTGEGGDA